MEINLYHSKKSQRKNFYGILIFGIASLFFGLDKQFDLVFFSLLLFIPLLVITFIDYFDTRPLITLNEIGIYDRSNRNPIINWEIIEEVYLGEFMGSSVIFFKTNTKYEPAFKRSKLWWKVNLWFFDKEDLMFLKLNLHEIEVDETLLLNLIKKIIQLKRSDKQGRFNVTEDVLKEYTGSISQNIS